MWLLTLIPLPVHRWLAGVFARKECPPWPEFDGNKPSGTASLASEAVANILSQLSEGSTVTKTSAAKLVPTVPGLPALPTKLMERIVAGQYVDFTELPPTKGRTRMLPSSEEGHIPGIMNDLADALSTQFG